MTRSQWKTKPFEELVPGLKAEFEHTISQEDIDLFVRLTGDNNPLHTDRSYAEKTAYKDIVVHGMLGASFVSTLVGKYLPGEGSLWVSQNFQFLLPIRRGDRLRIIAEVLKKNESLRLVVLKTDVFNQSNQLVIGGEGTVKVLETTEKNEKKTPASNSKVALVTGASRGIGARTAVLLAERGYRVGINFRSDEEGAARVLQEIESKGGQGLLLKGDVTEEDSVHRMVNALRSKFGSINALVNNASDRILTQAFSELRWADFQRQIDVAVKGAFLCTQAVLDDFLKNGRGAVVSVSSIVVDSVPSQQSPYVVAKAGLELMTKSLATEFGPQGLRFNIVSPGMTETALISDVSERHRLLFAAQTPLRKLAQPEDVASAIAFLLSDESSHMTGETLRVCGGKVMG